jgi:anaerobic carbon-monoxide dehydrogenase iron sulfur subunit
MKTIFVNPERCVACRTCEIACAVNRSSLSRKLPEAIYEAVPPLSRVRVDPAATEKGFPVQCRHCDEAPCLDACPAGALYRDEEGLVLVRDERCVGCWMCVMVCPFGAPQPFRSYRKIIKCDRCKGMEGAYCVESCPTGAMILVDSEDIASGRFKPPRKRTWTGLNFASGQEGRKR